ncbi:PQQ-dependent sugar dehydrogenase [Opitutaceae bacterium]|nr:PQQ-dependent sugar dehydrogenase [Opitutaceae bacterium]
MSHGQEASDALPFGQPVADPIESSGLTIQLERFIQMPSTSESLPKTRINEMTALMDGSGRLFINDLRGQLYEVSSGEATLYMDYAALVPELHHATGLGSGLGSVAFHPEFDSNGKFYTTHVERAKNTQASSSARGFSRGWTVGVVSEWTASDPNAEKFNGKQRELLRVEFPTDTHGLQQIAFNPNSLKVEPDYGMLYICVGEGGSMQMGRNEYLRNLSSPLGCILRIDPAGSGGALGDYGIPPDNPWADSEDAEVLGEIWAMGMRNPHRISWDRGGSGRLLFGDIGEMRIEEVNIGEAGRDYGWPIREGVYRFDSNTRHLVYSLNEEQRKNEPDLTYPVSQYDHMDGYAISGGGIYRGQALPELIGKYIFGDIVSGRLFYVGESELDFGSLAPIWELNVRIGDELTSLARLIGGGRVDLRFGWDAEGELYVFEKGQGIVYKAVDAGWVDEEGIELKGLDRQIIEHTLKVDPDHAVVAGGENPMIDDMEDGDSLLLPREGRAGSWTMPDSGASIRRVESEDAPGEGSRVMEIRIEDSERRGPTVAFSFVGKSESGDEMHYDASVYDGIQFWVKGNQRARMSFDIATPYTIPLSEGGLCDGENYECWNVYECRVYAEEEWTLARLPFTRFLQGDLPNDGPLDPAILKSIEFSVRPRPGLTLWIDDLSFYRDE